MRPDADALEWMLEDVGEPVSSGGASSFGIIRRADLTDGETIVRRVVAYRLTYAEEKLPDLVAGATVVARGRSFEVVGFDPAESTPGLQVAFMEEAADA
jgi:hypothetical protein